MIFRIDIPPSSVYGEMVRTQKREKTRVFSGRDEHEVERNARTNGYEYAKEDPKCTRGKCRQRWGGPSDYAYQERKRLLEGCDGGVQKRNSKHRKKQKEGERPCPGESCGHLDVQLRTEVQTPGYGILGRKHRSGFTGSSRKL